MANPERVPTHQVRIAMKWIGLSIFLVEKCTNALYSEARCPCIVSSQITDERVVMHDRDKFSCQRL